MIILVTGGTASGKSALAEGYCSRLGVRTLYVATMEPLDGESRERVRRHRAQRAGLGFDTLECYRDLAGVRLDAFWDTALLECLGNLVANQMFAAASPPEQTARLVWEGVQFLARQVKHLVVVSNDIFRDGTRFDGDMAAYLDALNGVSCQIAAMADLVVEAVCGLPVIHKGRWLQDESVV